MIVLAWDNVAQNADLVRPNGKNILASDDRALETAVLLSLFSDRIAGPDDDLPPDADPRGYWADAFAEVDGDLEGSRLWLAQRMNQKNALLYSPRYAEEALAWMLEDQVATSIKAAAVPLTMKAYQLGVQIERPGRVGRWERFWELQNAI